MKWLSQSMVWSFKYKTIGVCMNNEIIKFVNGDLQLDVTVSPDNETVWLNYDQLSQNLRQFKDQLNTIS